MAVRIIKIFQILQFHTTGMGGPKHVLGVGKLKVKSLVLQLVGCGKIKVVVYPDV